MKCKYLKEALEAVCEKSRDPEDKFCWNIEKDMKKCKHFIEVNEKKP
jgi:hypothetical protein